MPIQLFADGLIDLDPGHARYRLLADRDTIELQTADQAAQVLIRAGRPLNEPIIQYGPFVMNARAEIRQAIANYEPGRLVTPP